MKRCVKCGVVQPLEAFYRAKGTRDGLRGDCKSCFKARAKARYPLVRERNIARAQKWREDNLERFRQNQRRMRSTPEGKAKQRAGHLKRKYGMTIETIRLAAVETGRRLCHLRPATTARHIPAPRPRPR